MSLGIVFECYINQGWEKSLHNDNPRKPLGDRFEMGFGREISKTGVL